MASFPIYHKDSEWKIWFKRYVDGEFRGSGVWWRDYKHKSSAVRAAKKYFGDRTGHFHDKTITYEWIVSKTNPWEEE